MKKLIERDRMIVEIHLKETTLAIPHVCDNAYQKGDFYCLCDLESRVVYKYPVANIWRIREPFQSKRMEEENVKP